MWREADVFSPNGRDKFAIHSCGGGAAKRVVRLYAEKESSACILDVDDEAGGRVLHGVGRHGMSFAAIEDHGVVAELQRQSRGVRVTAGHTEAGHERRIRAQCIDK